MIEKDYYNPKDSLKLIGLDSYFDQLMKEGYLNTSEEKLVLTREGQLKCDAIGSRLLSLGA